METKKTILINSSLWQPKSFEQYAVKSINIFSINIFDRILRYLCRKVLKIPHTFRMKKNWTDSLEGCKLIILFDSTESIVAQSRIIENYVDSDVRLVLFLMNPMSYIEKHIAGVSDRWEVWSFSEQDSKQYGFKYGETFFLEKQIEKQKTEKPVYDSFFIGKDKGRKAKLAELKSLYISKGLSNSLFYIVDNKKAIYSRQYKKAMSYALVLRIVQSSKSITEVMQQNQDGFTLRVMESIFLKRKLITTNSSIKNRRIYCPKNIFILGEDNVEHLYEFVNAPYKEIDSEEVNKYEFASWLQRIVENKEFG